MSERLDLEPETSSSGSSNKSERRKRVQSIMKGLGSLEVELQERAVAKKAAMDSWSKGVLAHFISHCRVANSFSIPPPSPPPPPPFARQACSLPKQ